MKWIKMSSVAAMACALSTSVYADDAAFQEKRTLKNNMMENYKVLPKSVDSFTEAFSEGILYGRLRSNWFKWDWKNDDTAATKNKDNDAFGIGGSLIYKTAPFHGVSATAGLYYGDNAFPSMRMDRDEIGYTKAGKDTFSRNEVATQGIYSMAVLAQAYLQYDISKTSFKVGRQIFESFLTKSNDTKMIPNTFEGYSVETKEIPDTRLRAAYFYKQKLRDHTTFHDVITFKDSTGNKWNNNDDAGVHKGLTYQNFEAAGEDTSHALIVADARNKSIPNLQLDVTYAGVPDVVSSLTGEANYKIDLGDKMSLTPGVRYMMQMDDGGGAIGGAGLSGALAGWQTGDDKLGYATPDSLDSSLVMARLTFKTKALIAQVGYSAVEDAGDIVAPWRGFPTGGYTRAMAQYNWRANTKTTAAEVHYDFGKANILPGFNAMVRYAMQDFDEEKQVGGVQADSNVVHIDLTERFPSVPGLMAKVRVGLIDANERENGTEKDSYNEYRFELNYLF